MKHYLIFICVAILIAGGSLFGQTGFPRIGGYNIGAPHNYHEKWYQQQLAKRDVIILGLYRGWNEGGKTPAQVVNEIKALNPGILIGNYTIMESKFDVGDFFYRAKLSSEIGPGGMGDWWARDNTGNQTDWAAGEWGSHDVNITSWVIPDVHGDTWPQWLAKTDYQALLQGVDFDFWYFDNNFWRPRSEPDWNGDGMNDSHNDIIVKGWWREGQRAHYEQAAIEAPHLMRMVNADSDLSGKAYPPNADFFIEYTNIVHGALLEYPMNINWSPENWGSWEMMTGWYHSVFNALLSPKIVLFVVGGCENNYQIFRYAFASCLLDDGYFVSVRDTQALYDSYDSLLWFDEYDLAGKSTTKWLGAAKDMPATAPWKQGIYKREFENGMAIVNPKGNGTQTISIPAGYKRIAGIQDTVVNNGQPLSSVTLQERDGIILVKTSFILKKPQKKAINNLLLFPNPNDGLFNLSFTLSNEGIVAINVMNQLGRTIQHKQCFVPAGKYDTQFDLTNFPNGIYFVQIIADNDIESIKLFVQKN